MYDEISRLLSSFGPISLKHVILLVSHLLTCCLTLVTQLLSVLLAAHAGGIH